MRTALRCIESNCLIKFNIIELFLRNINEKRIKISKSTKYGDTVRIRLLSSILLVDIL